MQIFNFSYLSKCLKRLKFTHWVDGVCVCVGCVLSFNQNSNSNRSLTSIIAFNYIYLFARTRHPPLAADELLLLSMMMMMPTPDSGCGRAIGFALIRISFMHGVYRARLLFYFILFHFFSLSLSLSLTHTHTQSSLALLWLSCFIQQLMRKLAVVWIIYNSTHVEGNNTASCRANEDNRRTRVKHKSYRNTFCKSSQKQSKF